MARIEQLTPEQANYLPIFRQEYLDAAIGGKRADRPHLEASVADAYGEIGKKAPLVVILQSPLQAMMAIKFMQALASKELGGQLWGQLRDQLWGQLGDQLWDQLGGQLWDQLRGQLWDQLRDQLWDQLRGQLWGQLRGQLWDQLRDQLWGQLWDQLWGQLRDQLWDQLGGQLWGQLRDQLWDQLRGQPIYNPNYLWGSQDLYWIAWAKFAEHIGVKLTDEASRRLEIMRRIGFECEWWWPYEGFCFVSERPLFARFDEARRLHCDDGPALRYDDGYSLFAWHGLRIPAWLIEDKARITPDVIDAESNTELRRVMLEIFGFDRYIEARGAKLIAEDECLGLPRHLFDINLAGERVRVLRVNNGTVEADGRRRQFHLGVPLECETPHQAVAWSYGRPAERHAEAVRS